MRVVSRLPSLIFCIGTGVWEDPAPYVYEMTLIAAFSHSTIHPLLLLFLHEPLRQELRAFIIDSCCCFCTIFGIEFRDDASTPPTPIRVRDYEKSEDVLSGISTGVSLGRRGNGHSGSHPHLHSFTTDTVVGFGSRSMESLNKTRRTPSFKSHRSFSEVLCRANSSGSCHMFDDGVPPPPLPPINAAFRKQVNPFKSPSIPTVTPLNLVIRMKHLFLLTLERSLLSTHNSEIELGVFMSVTYNSSSYLSSLFLMTPFRREWHTSSQPMCH